MRIFTRLKSDTRGAAVIELAIVAPILATMVIGMTDISMAYARQLELEQGSQRAIEKVQQTTGDDTVEDTIKNEAVCQVNGTNADGSCKSSPITTANVTVTYRLECTGGSGTSAQETTDSAAFADFVCGSDESRASYLRVEVRDTYTPMFSIHFGTAADGKYHLAATAGVRTQ